jgi:hypothetical protein
MTTAGYIMARSASLLNDTNRHIYTDVNLVPYLNVALQELREEMELNNVAYTNDSSVVLPLNGGIDNIGGITGPGLPTGLVEIQELWQSERGSNARWTPIVRYEFLPHGWENFTQITSSVPCWAWQGQVVKMIPANTPLDIRMDFIRSNLADISDAGSVIQLINCENVLAYRTAGLGARYIGENPTRADSLDGDALRARDNFLGINTKGRQSIRSRRRPFQAGYKSRNFQY